MDKVQKIAYSALLLALIGLSASGITTNNYNTTYYNNTSSNGSIDPTLLNQKINKSGDTVSDNFILWSNDYHNRVTLSENLSTLTGNVPGSPLVSLVYASDHASAGIRVLNSTSGEESSISLSPNTILFNEKTINQTIDRNLANFSNSLGWINNSTMWNSSLPLSGGNMTGELDISMPSAGYSSILNSQTNFTEYYENNTIRSWLTIGGTQAWKFRNATFYEAGMLTYSLPNGFPGIVFYNPSLSNRTEIVSADAGLEFGASTGTGGFSRQMKLSRPAGELTLTNLSGSGNAYVCVNSNGKLYRGNPTCT